MKSHPAKPTKRVRIAVALLNAAVAVGIVLGLMRMWKSADPLLWIVASSLIPSLTVVLALLLPRVPLIALAAAVPNFLVFLGGLADLGWLIWGNAPYFPSRTVGVALLLSFGALNFAVAYGQYLSVRSQHTVPGDGLASVGRA